MNLNAQKIAEKASFQAFFNGYLKEVDVGEWRSTRHVDTLITGHALAANTTTVEVSLRHIPQPLVAIVDYRTQVGCHVFSEVYLKHESHLKPLSFLDAQLMLIESLYFECSDNASHHKHELTVRVLESHAVMTRYINERLDDPSRCSMCFIGAEQSLLFGHWQHPTPKSRQGMLDYHHLHYAPELQGQFKLHYFSVAQSLVRQRSALTESAEDIIRTSLPVIGQIPNNHAVLPMHPVQAQWLLHQPHVEALIERGEILDLGVQGVRFTATSSVRSLYNPDLEWMYKFSLPVKITNSLRVNKRAELDAGVVMATLYKKTGFAALYPSFRVITDPAYITLSLPELSESGFEVIIRENPFTPTESDNVVTIAALTQAPLPGETSMLAKVIGQLAASDNANMTRIAIKWFAKYWECAIEPMLRLYDEHGIALEAHQQNSVIRLEDGYPSIYYFRDNQGFYLSKSYRSYLADMEPESVTVDSLYFDDDIICDRFAYYLMINHLFSIVGRMGADGLVDEGILISFVQQRLSAMQHSLSGAGKLFVDRLLSRATIPAKANLLTRVHDVDELLADNEQAIYCELPNPLMMTCLEEAAEVKYAVA
ncbi:IucA/IucC family protein [Enterovibrio coralii]|uniref:IucA/IucC family protein n=1 Tax=Enterovibrio coralii TaxID=294935 RepID=UPI000B01D0D0|nr:IucA/IucC family protein [Enterovibrio coralii]